MYGRGGLDRFRKAQSSDPFSVAINSAPKAPAQHAAKRVSSTSIPSQQAQLQKQLSDVPQKPVALEAAPLVGQTQHLTQIGGGQSTWQPPDWAIEPRSGVYYLEVLKDGEVLDRINLDRRRQLFGRQAHACDFVLDHQSVSRQHAAVVPHKNGSIFVIDMGSAHGTFVANERLTKDTPVELEVGQSLRFAASTRTYILRKNNAALFSRPPPPSEIDLLPPPDPSDEEAVLSYNTLLNRHGLSNPDLMSKSSSSLTRRDESTSGRATKRVKKARVTFRDQVGGELVQVVGYSDGVDVETEPGPIGVTEGSLVGKYESLVHTTIIPKGKEQLSEKENNTSQLGVTNKLQEVFKKVRTPSKGGGMYDNLYGEAFPGKLGSSWAYSSSVTSNDKQDPPIKDVQQKVTNNSSSHKDDVDDDDDLFGD
ncbi:hypothetical protein M5689_009922 [Euphorbia peplus]|nr:hypothetical protein M5689_009922 [Euphorbia peplus]